MADALTGIREASQVSLPQISTRKSSAGFNFPVITSTTGDRTMSLNHMRAVGSNDRYAVRLIDRQESGTTLLFAVTVRENKTPLVWVSELTQNSPPDAELLDPSTDVFRSMKMQQVSTEHVAIGNLGNNEGFYFNLALRKLLTDWTGPDRTEFQAQLTNAGLDDLIGLAEHSTLPR